MPKVKICGLTRTEDALLAVREGADYIGIVLYQKSPRFVPPERRGEILRSVSEAKKVAVMVNPSYEEAISVLEEGFDLIQLHGEESFDLARKIGVERVIKVFRVKDKLPEIGEEWKKVHALLLDTYRKDLYGGTGETFNWDIARKLVERGFRVILSGGLNPKNVISAIEKVKPYGVDVSSGVELSPGVKSGDLLRDFIKKVKGSIISAEEGGGRLCWS